MFSELLPHEASSGFGSERLSPHIESNWGYNKEGLNSHEPPRTGGPLAWLLDEELTIPH
jgi:hypothetical protein